LDNGKKEIKKENTLRWTLAIGMAVILCGCMEEQTSTSWTGFLSDYSKLEAVSDTSFRYMAPGNPLARYSKFIIEPVAISVSSNSMKDITQEDLTDLKNYMHSAVVDTIKDRHEIVYRPGHGVARVRIALTDLKQSSTVQNVMPLTKLAGTGLGGASLEAELLDSQTHKQIGAIVESQLGNRLSLAGISTWGMPSQ
jgi:hypothetical protein